MPNATKDEVHNEALRKIAHASEDVRAAKERYLAEQHAAWNRYVAVIEKALKDDLRLSADPTPSPDPVREVLDLVHGRIDDLRIRAHLGRMELADLATELHDAASKVVDLLRP